MTQWQPIEVLDTPDKDWVVVIDVMSEEDPPHTVAEYGVIRAHRSRLTSDIGPDLVYYPDSVHTDLEQVRAYAQQKAGD